MSLSPRKFNQQKHSKNSQQTFNQQYLNFIRRNHFKFEVQERTSFKYPEENDSLTKQSDSVADDKKQFHQLNGQRRMEPLHPNDELGVNEKQSKQCLSNVQKTNNHRTIDVVPQKKQKYMNLGSSTIIPMKNHSFNKNGPNVSQVQLKNYGIHQNILQNQSFIKILYKKNKQIAQKLLFNQKFKNQELAQRGKPKFSVQPIQLVRKNQVNNQKLLQLNLRNCSPLRKQESDLLTKNKNLRNHWKQNFSNLNQNIDLGKRQRKRYEKKKPQSQLKFPSITRGVNSNSISKRQNQQNDDNIHNSSMIGDKVAIQLQKCYLIKKSKPKPIIDSYNRFDGFLVNNKSIQLLSHQSLQLQKARQKRIEDLKQHKSRNISQWKISLMKRQDSIQSYHKQMQNQNPEVELSLLQYRNSSVSLVKRTRRKNVPHKMTNFLTSSVPQEQSTQLKISRQKNYKKNHKQIAKSKQKQLQRYLMDNSIVKSSKIIYYYEKKEHKKRLIFDQMQNKKYYGSKQKSVLGQLNNIKSDFLSQRQNEQPSKNSINCGLNRKMSQSDTNVNHEKQNQISEQSTQSQNQVLKKSLQLNTNSILIDKTSLKVKKKQKKINFMKIDNQLSIYEIKIRSYRQFLFMVNLAHKVLLPLALKPVSQFKNQAKFTYFIGKGNNRLLIKSLMNRRFWWEQTKDQNKANFVWTQLKINEIFQYEKVSDYQKSQDKFDKLQQESNENCQSKKYKQMKNAHRGAQKAGFYKAPLPQSAEMKIFTRSDRQIYQKMVVNISQNPQKNSNFNNRLKYLSSTNLTTNLNEQSLHTQKVHNHLQSNYFIGNKKALFYNLQNYYKLLGKDVFQIIPFTLHIKKGVQDSAYNRFLKQYKKIEKQQSANCLKNLWIVKPGELSNRGQGITVIDQVYEVKNILKKRQKHKNGVQKSYILQKYIQNPLLYKNRKFDIRHYVLITRFHGRLRTYFYGQGYIRTSSHEFKLDQLDEMIHLTNDAIQQCGDSYGKHQDGNKVSYTQFQRYLDSTYGQNKHNFSQQIYPRMKQIALDAIKATYLQLDPKGLQHNFQLLGLDYMIDNKFNVWLIQVNTNPCLQLSSKLLQRVIPQMAENTLRLTVDPVFPPPTHFPNSLKHVCPDSPLQRLKYELIFDEARDGQQLEKMFQKCNLKQLHKDMGQVDQQDDTFQNDGKQIQLRNQKQNQADQ